MFGFIAQPLVKWLAIGLAFVGIAVTAYIFYLKYEGAVAEKAAIQTQLNTAISVNQQNAKDRARLEKSLQISRQATEKLIAEAKERDAKLKELEDAISKFPHASDPAGEFWDALSQRLRQ